MIKWTNAKNAKSKKIMPKWVFIGSMQKIVRMNALLKKGMVKMMFDFFIGMFIGMFIGIVIGGLAMYKGGGKNDKN